MPDSLSNAELRKQAEDALQARKERRELMQEWDYEYDRPKEAPISYQQLFITGNDPEFTEIAPYKSTSDKPVVLLATSCLRALSLACELSNDTTIPKIILIDNDPNVHQFWDEIIEHMLNSSNKEEFLARISQLKEDRHINTQDRTLQIFNGDPEHYLEQLITQHGFERIQGTLFNMNFLQASWADKDLPQMVQQYFNREEIGDLYAYPSNILAYIRDNKTQRQLIDNIQTLNPTLAIHTDLIVDRPKNAYYLTNHEYTHVHQSVVINPQFNDTSTNAATQTRTSRSPLSAASLFSQQTTPDNQHDTTQDQSPKIKR